jgi:hypothetical protein|tara:strand:+ start:153 stop:602 length:450 start_codon:yes stop_codon:yes gene_type:complete
LRVKEVVRDTHEEALAALLATPTPCYTHVCAAGHAADFTVHHLIGVDSDKALADLFDVTLHHIDGEGRASTTTVVPTLRDWGDGPVKTPQEALAAWQASAKPKGNVYAGHTLGALAQVIRSKNAGVNEITFDCIFTTSENYLLAKGSPR